MAEFTWECLGADACDTCEVKAYLLEHPDTTYAQRNEMAESASSEIGWRELPVEEVVAELQKDSSTRILSTEALTVSIRGVRQWNELHCRKKLKELAKGQE